MDWLNWDLDLLRRAVAYTNLSSAANHVGVSQPQLSRIVARLEKAYDVTLLDRSARRKSAWTPAAIDLAGIYERTVRNFHGEIQKLIEGTHPSHIRLGTLEGLVPIAIDFCRHALELGDAAKVEIVEIVVADLNELEEQFLKRGLELVLTSREPSRKKFRYVRKLGTQRLETVRRPPGAFQVMSSWEFGSRSRPQQAKAGAEKPAPIVVSNSLAVRKAWVERFGGVSTLPSEVKKGGGAGGQGTVDVLLIGDEDLPQAFWKAVSAFGW